VTQTRVPGAGGGPLVSAVRRHLAEAATDARAAVLFRVPGRIEVLGKHTDYAGGRSLVGAVDRAFVVGGVPRADGTVHVTDARTGERCETELAPDAPARGPAWSTYLRAVVSRLARNFPSARTGADIVLASDLPPASGMSSSSALMVGLFLVLGTLNDVEAAGPYRSNIATREDLAAYLATIENGLSFGTLAGDRGVGTFGGSEDHTAILLSEAGALKQFSFCPTRHERTIALPRGVAFAIASSGVVAEKTGAARDAYNRAALAAQRVLQRWNEATGRRDPSLAAACAASGEARALIGTLVARGPDGEFTADVLSARFAQFAEESLEIVPRAADALATGDFTRFGRIVDRSQQLAESCLHNQVPETIALARGARVLGAYAASAFGAGFGGSVWALVTDDRAEAFVERWRERYTNEFPARAAAATFFVTAAGAGAGRIETGTD
jgi:galactokinase